MITLTQSICIPNGIAGFQTHKCWSDQQNAGHLRGMYLREAFTVRLLRQGTVAAAAAAAMRQGTVAGLADPVAAARQF